MEAENLYSLEWTEHVKTIGRAFVYNNVLWLTYSGAGIEFECSEGFELELTADNVNTFADAENRYPRYALLKDGRRVIDGRLDENQRTLRIENAEEHVFTFIKLSESNESSLGIAGLRPFAGKAPQEVFKPTPAGRLKIEFVGDSITCGYGVDGSIGECFTTATEDVSGAWSWLTALRLGADYSICSKSGAGIISGYTGDGARNCENIIAPYYDLMGCSATSIEPCVRPQNFEYDYSFEPDIVILNIGTNDISFCHPVDDTGRTRLNAVEEEKRRREFYREYKAFVMHLREKNPFAKIICTLGVMGGFLNDEAQTAAEELKMAGDSRIYWLPLKEHCPEDGFGTDYHPSRFTQERVADTVAKFIEEII